MSSIASLIKSLKEESGDKYSILLDFHKILLDCLLELIIGTNFLR